jgi:dipeptidyl-peptidase-4
MTVTRSRLTRRLSASLIAGILIVSGAAAQGAGRTIPARTKAFTIDDIFVKGKFNGKSMRGFQWIENGRAYSYLETDTSIKQTNLWRYDVASGKKTELVDAKYLVLKEGEQPFSIQNYVWSSDRKKLLFTGSLTARRLKTGGNFFLYEPGNKKFRQLTKSDEEQVNVKFSPDGSMIGFVRGNNLFLHRLDDDSETQLTFDGAPHVRNGHFDWVYEEEFGLIDGWQWSPDGKYIAYWQIDENREPEFPITDFLPLHQEVKKMRYPKAGDPNGIVRIGILDLASRKTVWADIGAPLDSTQDTYVPRIKWTNRSGLLAVERLNRHQNKLELTFVDASTGRANIVLTEAEQTWIDVRDDLTFLKKGDQFLWSSDRDGYLHLYLYGMDGKLVRQLTQGRWDVERLNGVDESSGMVYFTAGIVSPLGREVYAVGLDGKGFKRLTKEDGSNSANFAPDFSVFLHTFTDVNTPSKVSLRKNDGTLVRVVDDGTIGALAEYAISPQTFFTFKTSDGLELNGWMIKPADFDPAKKYPVLMSVYGGPGSQTVRNSWGGQNFLWYQLLAQKGYIVASIDNRGTGARGKEFESVTYKHLGKWETNDQIEGAKYLSTLPFVDGSRIGIWGWSYGGYMTLMSVLMGADVFKTGVSVAPVTHWKFYDSIYTERYMLTPQENPEGYEESAPLTHAANLKGNLLEIHGTADDNVHWQNTVSMVNAFNQAGKQFETAFYPGGLHGIGTGKLRAQLFTRITNFILDKL